MTTFAHIMDDFYLKLRWKIWSFFILQCSIAFLMEIEFLTKWLDSLTPGAAPE